MEFNNGFLQPHTPNEVGSHNNVVEVLSPTKPSSPAAQIEVERKFQVLFSKCCFSEIKIYLW